METHIRNAGRLLYWTAIIMGVAAVIAFIVAGGFSGLLLTDNPFYKRKDLASIPLERVVALIYICYSVLMAAPVAIAGKGISEFKPWARTFGMLIAAINMLNFPIGTAVGAYTVWALSDETTEFLFENRPPNA